MSEELNRRWTDHNERITALETKAGAHDDLIKQLTITQSSICATLKQIENNTLAVVELMRTARGIKSIIVWISPVVLCFVGIITLVKAF